MNALRRLSYLVGCMFAIAGTSAEAAKGPRVAPGKWAIEYAKDECVLSRDGPAGEPGVALRTRPFSDDHVLLIYMARTGEKQRSIKGWLGIGGDAWGGERWITIGEQRRPYKSISTRVSTEELAKIALANSIRLSSADRLELTVALPMIATAMSALRRCEINLAGELGIDPLEMEGWARTAHSETDLRSMFWSEDRSSTGILRRPVRAILEIDARGAVAACTIKQSSRVAWVDAKFCDTLRTEGKFRPAVDFSGKPVRSKLVTPLITTIRLR